MRSRPLLPSTTSGRCLPRTTCVAAYPNHHHRHRRHHHHHHTQRKHHHHHHHHHARSLKPIIHARPQPRRPWSQAHERAQTSAPHSRTTNLRTARKGFLRIENFLPTAVAEGLLESVQALPVSAHETTNTTTNTTATTHDHPRHARGRSIRNRFAAWWVLFGGRFGVLVAMLGSSCRSSSHKRVTPVSVRRMEIASLT